MKNVLKLGMIIVGGFLAAESYVMAQYGTPTYYGPGSPTDMAMQSDIRMRDQMRMTQMNSEMMMQSMANLARKLQEENVRYEQIVNAKDQKEFRSLVNQQLNNNKKMRMFLLLLASKNRSWNIVSVIDELATKNDDARVSQSTVDLVWHLINQLSHRKDMRSESNEMPSNY